MFYRPASTTSRARHAWVSFEGGPYTPNLEENRKLQILNNEPHTLNPKH